MIDCSMYTCEEQVLQPHMVQFRLALALWIGSTAMARRECPAFRLPSGAGPSIIEAGLRCWQSSVHVVPQTSTVQDNDEDVCMSSRGSRAAVPPPDRALRESDHVARGRLAATWVEARHDVPRRSLGTAWVRRCGTEMMRARSSPCFANAGGFRERARGPLAA